MMNIRHSISTSTCHRLAVGLSAIGLVVLASCSARDLGSRPIESDSQTESKHEAIAAVIEGRAITFDELHEHMKDQFLSEFLRQPEDRQFEMREIAVRDLVQKHVMEIEAQKQAKTSQELLDEIAKSVAEPTIDEIAEWFSKNQTQLRGAKLENVAGSIAELMLTERRTKAMSAYLDPKIKALSWRMVLMPPRIELEVTRLIRGSTDAPVTIMTFSDYQCPYCVRAEPILAEILERYPDQVRLVHRHFPLDTIHAFARPAAEASMCADEQGKFWEYHDGIFGRQRKLGEADFAGIASSIGLDTDAFILCREERRYKDYVESDFVAGREAGVTGTPSFFLNGIKLKGARNVDELSHYVDLELGRIEQD